ncbi:nucleoside 2-deoxyribosyltransferase [Salibacterium salarium]|uniref:Nucleoside 2-deoxyribosyltransferase n=1 Tax=Salibacterium salarium TaxID=284579 RepID=A0A428MWS8_9BACI|nr:nucleoside 2-deoxyribosyltransferase [Salibacterium salarium]RSL30602.1 nucleoside 2-deoxyribosyltransferase [Salibacterium salarium]
MNEQFRKIFLAGPFKRLVNSETGAMDNNEKQKLLNLIDFFERRGLSVHNAHKREDWGKNFMSPEECTETDYKEISSCDLFVAFPGSPASPGTHIEIGWASALKKPIILLLEQDKDYAFLIQGLEKVANVTYVRFNQEKDYVSKLEEYLS